MMKHIAAYLAVIVLLLALMPASAQEVSAESPIILGGTSDDAISDSLSLSNGNIILSISSNGGRNGAAPYAGHIRKVWLVCLAPDGSTVWENEFGDDRSGGYTHLNQLALVDENSFSGLVSYSIDQRSQYWQMMTFSTLDGSLIHSGERVMDTMEEDNIYRTFSTSGNYRIALETHNFNTTLKPRMLRLLDINGHQLWELNATENGISHMAQFIPATQGTVLYGRQDIADTLVDEAVAMLVDTNGNVVWEYRFHRDNTCVFNRGIIDSQDRVVLIGTVRGDLITNEEGNAVGYGDNTSLLIVCLDVSTGAEIFTKTYEMKNLLLPSHRIAEYNGQYILSGSGANYNTIEYQSVDMDGNLLKNWSVGYPEYGIFPNNFILWNGELWSTATLDGEFMDVFLTRVEIP